MNIITINSKKHGVYNAIIDEDFYDYFKTINWFLSKDKKRFYIACWIKNQAGDFVKFKMHQMVMGEYDRRSYIIDHINRNPLDNRKSNLRLVTWAENSMNRNPIQNKKVPYKGVSYSQYKGKKSYNVTIQINGKKVFESGFANAEDAARRYNTLAIQYHGEFAYQNPV